MRTGQRADLAAILAVALTLLAAGCRYMPTVAGRPAAVLAGDREALLFGGGVFGEGTGGGASGEVLEADERYPLLLFEASLGGRVDLALGTEGNRGFGVVRWQVAGLPRVPGSPGGPSFDVSLEAGTSAIIWFYEYQVEGHLGANFSAPFAWVTPYLSVRRHWLNGGSYEDRDEQWRMLYLGLEFHRPYGSSSIAVEFFHGELTGYAGPYGEGMATDKRGVNVLWRTAAW